MVAQDYSNHFLLLLTFDNDRLSFSVETLAIASTTHSATEISSSRLTYELPSSLRFCSSKATRRTP